MLSNTATQILLILCALFPQGIHSYELVFYSGSGCRGQALGTIITGQTRDECKRDYSGNAGSILVSSTGAVDDNYMVVLYGSDDCNLKNEVQHGDDTDFCLEEPYKGFQVVDTGMVEDVAEDA
ncbi:uncharacterized protein DNG_05157 [Cephalotrichum gorgonifer]|uniref:Uncharacterized protein n=1 Tax=Cephalotrichum gorgonifer TaxID=2041049 RepID=A0AAE8MZF2_9PEZI|nr:uncharacterized protein DNG_05157 [Cephalotrichum gorgonifer]